MTASVTVSCITVRLLATYTVQLLRRKLMGLNMKFLILVFPVMFDFSIQCLQFFTLGSVLMTSECTNLTSIRVSICTY
jgi:hypothetical protein